MVPTNFVGIGYDRVQAGLPLTRIVTPVPSPGPGEILVEVHASSLNPLEYKLADINFLGRIPPVVLGFDLAGLVIAVGPGVRSFAPGDRVMAMADCDRDGGWAEGGPGYAIARECLAAKMPDRLGYGQAGTLPVCYLAAYLALAKALSGAGSILIPGGGGGVGHLAIQLASRVFGVEQVITSVSSENARDLALRSGASVVLDRRFDDVAGAVAELTGGAGVDLVFDSTYSEASFELTAALVRQGGSWTVLGVGPGKTTRRSETTTRVPEILASRGASLRRANVLDFFAGTGSFDDGAKALFASAMTGLSYWTGRGLIEPEISDIIPCSVEAISLGLAEMKAGRSRPGKVSVSLIV